MKISVLILICSLTATAEEINKIPKDLLIEHIIKGDVKSVDSELKTGMDVNFVTGSIDETPLTLAAFNGRAKILEMLIAHKANVNAEAKNGMTALMFAAYANVEGIEKEVYEKPNYLRVISILLKNHADVNAKNKKGESALEIATKNHRNPEIIKLLSQQKNN
jgi:ankyrin repeat protein